ncbi:copper chaperone [Metabacillus crassostreae]|uniref:copper chaperone CopZ n=1 Tax=Metabacillus crassostreae TaxID=929098 RepID=UPI00195A9B85|nr:copper chaperone CopZ [Metabacillus crassostreae]MBM7603035.1 copper chaperone [Metabacillus crassostreae]
MEKVSLKVKGMSCDHCVKTIEENVGTLNGVDRLLVDLEEEDVVIEYNADTISLDKLKEAIEEQGYEIES